MEPAFLQFSEPYAWLIRGLIEYGWEDLSLKPQNLPKRYAFNLRPFIETNGVKGIFLSCLAIDSNNQWYQQDRTYNFVLQLTTDKWNRQVFYMACREIGYYEEHLWVPEQPYYSSGYIHEAITEQIPKIVDKRQTGWSPPSRPQDDILEIQPSAELLMFLHQRYSYEQDMNTAIEEGLWATYQQEPDPYEEHNMYADPYQGVSQQLTETPVISNANAIGISPNNTQPVIGIGMGRSAMGLSMGYGDAQKNALMVKIELLANLFQSLAVFGIIIGFFELVNAGYTVYMIARNITVNPGNTYYISIGFNIILGIYSMLVGLISYLNNYHFREIQKGWKCWIPIGYAITQPVCAPVGIPLAIWAIVLYLKPEFKQYWKG